MREFNSSELVKVQDIDAALQIGRIFTAKIWSILCMFMLVVAVWVMGFSIIYCIIDIGDGIAILLASIGLEGASLALLLPMRYGKKKVKLWLQDAVIVKAQTKKAGESLTWTPARVSVKTTAIQIKFSYKEKHYVKSSIQKGKISCLQVYNKYVGRDILIAYSPTYDQVMLIKPKSEERIRSVLQG